MKINFPQLSPFSQQHEDGTFVTTCVSAWTHTFVRVNSDIFPQREVSHLENVQCALEV